MTYPEEAVAIFLGPPGHVRRVRSFCVHGDTIESVGLRMKCLGWEEEEEKEREGEGGDRGEGGGWEGEKRGD